MAGRARCLVLQLSTGRKGKCRHLRSGRRGAREELAPRESSVHAVQSTGAQSRVRGGRDGCSRAGTRKASNCSRGTLGARRRAESAGHGPRRQGLVDHVLQHTSKRGLHVSCARWRSAGGGRTGHATKELLLSSISVSRSPHRAPAGLYPQILIEK